MAEPTYPEPVCSGKPGRCDVHGKHKEPKPEVTGQMAIPGIEDWIKEHELPYPR